MSWDTIEAVRIIEYCEDMHAIENMMGRRAFMDLYIEEPKVFETMWSKSDPVLGTNNGYYIGLEAVEGYFKAYAEYTRLRAETARDLHPEELGGKEIDEILGAGAVHIENTSTPVIEIAGDRKTAKGIWYRMDSSIDYFPEGYGTRLDWGKLAVDFIMEDGDWKIWHMFIASDIVAPMGTNWTKPYVSTFKKEPCVKLQQFRFPEPTKKAAAYAVWSADRDLPKFPKVPEPYQTFSETFSYGMEGAL